MSFEGKVCVVTGGAGGIGLCIAKEFAAGGAGVAIIDKDFEAGTKAINEIRNGGNSGFFYCGDIGEAACLEAFAAEVISVFGKVDYLINNACLSRKGLLSSCNYDDFNYVLRVGITAPYYLTSLFDRYFNDNAAIVNISSTRAFMSQKDTESYTAAKGGITALTHAMSVSLAGRVRVNSVSPGWIDVRANYDKEYDREHSVSDKLQHPCGRVGKPEDIAKAVRFLCSPENRFITGQNLTVDGGMSKLMIYSGDDGWEFSG